MFYPQICRVLDLHICAVLSTPDVLSRIRCSAYGKVTIHRLVWYLHTRLLQPLINVIAVLLAIPLIVRRQSDGLVFDSTLYGLILAKLFAIFEVFASLGACEHIIPEIAAWGPVFIGGSRSA